MKTLLLAVVMLCACGPEFSGAASSGQSALASEAQCATETDSASCAAAGCAWRRGDGEPAATCHAASGEGGTKTGGGDTGTKTGGDTGTKTGGDTGSSGGGDTGGGGTGG